MSSQRQSEVDVSVVIPVRNGAAWIERQLAALAAQETTCTWEVVVADNGSTDDTAAVARRWALDFPVRLTVADASTRAGIGHARNAGVRASRGAVLAFCDCDDVVAPGWVEAAYAATRTADLVGGLNRLLTDPLDPDAEVLNPGCILQGTFGGAVIGCNFAVRRTAFLAVGGFDEALSAYGCDDVEFSIRVNDAGGSVAPAPDMVVYFRRTDDVRGMLRKTYRSGQAEIVVWARHARYADALGLRRSLLDLVRFPRDAVRGVRSGMPSRSLARMLVTRAARVTAQLPGSPVRHPEPAVLYSDEA